MEHDHNGRMISGHFIPGYWIEYHRLWRQAASVSVLLVSCLPAHAQIQVLQLRNQLNAGTRAIEGETLENRDAFCVVSVRHTDVHLTFSNTFGNSADGATWLAHNAAGEAQPYNQYIEYSDGSGVVEVSNSSSNVLVMPAAKTAQTTVFCGVGNIYKRVKSQITAVNGLKGPYSDTVTIVASPP